MEKNIIDRFYHVLDHSEKALYDKKTTELMKDREITDRLIRQYSIKNEFEDRVDDLSVNLYVDQSALEVFSLVKDHTNQIEAVHRLIK